MNKVNFVGDFDPIFCELPCVPRKGETVELAFWENKKKIWRKFEVREISHRILLENPVTSHFLEIRLVRVSC
jgi:hypothetical protein